MKDAVTELHRVRAIHDLAVKAPAPKIIPLKPMPIQTLVVNVTNQCNLACEYCYEYGEDKIVDTENGSQPKFMSAETARSAVDLALRESGAGKTAHITFFGGETLMNFKVLKSTVAYARETAAAQEQGRRLQPDHQRHAAAARRHRLPGRRAHRRHHLDRRPAGDPGQVPRLQQRQGQLRRSPRRRSRRCWPATRRGRSARASRSRSRRST